MNEVAVDVDEARTVVALLDNVRVPDFLVQRLRMGHDARGLTI